jgi:hypothetical protein
MKFAERELKDDTDYSGKNVSKIRLHSYVESGSPANVDPIRFKTYVDSTNPSYNVNKFTFAPTSGTPIAADVDVYILKSNKTTATDTSDAMKAADGSTRKYDMDDTVRYKFILPKG